MLDCGPHRCLQFLFLREKLNLSVLSSIPFECPGMSSPETTCEIPRGYKKSKIQNEDDVQLTQRLEMHNIIARIQFLQNDQSSLPLTPTVASCNETVVSDLFASRLHSTNFQVFELTASQKIQRERF